LIPNLRSSRKISMYTALPACAPFFSHTSTPHETSFGRENTEKRESHKDREKKRKKRSKKEKKRKMTILDPETQKRGRYECDPEGEEERERETKKSRKTEGSGSGRGAKYREKKKYIHATLEQQNTIYTNILLQHPEAIERMNGISPVSRPPSLSSYSLKYFVSRFDEFKRLYGAHIKEGDLEKWPEIGSDDDKYKWLKMIKERENRKLKKQMETSLAERVKQLKHAAYYLKISLPSESEVAECVASESSPSSSNCSDGFGMEEVFDLLF
jgi:hypothetical protein